MYKYYIFFFLLFVTKQTLQHKQTVPRPKNCQKLLLLLMVKLK